MAKALKITAIVLFLLILCFFGMQAWLGTKLKQVIEREGEKLDQGLYTVTVDNTSVNIFARAATVKGIKLIPDRSDPENRGKSDMIYEVSIDGVYATGLNMKLLKKGSGAKLRSIEIDRPLVTADVYKPRGEATENDKDTSEVVKPFDIPVKRIVVRDGNIIFRQHDGGEASYTEGDGIDFDIALRGAVRFDTLSVREMADGRLSVRSILMTNRDGSVDTKIDSVSYDTKDGGLRIASIGVDPKYPMEQFVYKSEKHTDWTKLSAKDIYIGGLDALFMEGNPFIGADSIHIEAGHVESYKDRNATQPYRYKKLFFESVQQLPFPLRVDKIVIVSMDAVYRELPQFGTEPGIINFTRLSGVLTGLTNIPSSTEPYYTLSAHGMLYGAAPLNATFRFPKSKDNSHFDVSGSLGSLDMTVLNKTVVPLAKAEVEEGTIDGMDFYISGNSSTASVDLTLLYHGLKIALVKRNGDNEIKERRFLSWIANEFVVKESNPRPDGETVKGAGTAQRDPDRSQFNFLWRTLLEGIKQTAGI